MTGINDIRTNSETAVIELFHLFWVSRGGSGVKLTSKVVKYGSQPLKLGDRLLGVSILGVSLEPSSFVVEEHLRNVK